jgi:hypothetical protein
MATKLPTVEQIIDERDNERTGQAIAVADGILNVIAKAAADPNTDVDKLERLLAMQERVLQREAEQAFFSAMRSAQEEIRPVLRNKTNASTSSKFADLEAISDAIDPIIHRHGFSLSYGSDESPMPSHYRVTCTVSHTGGHTKDYHADVPTDMHGIKGSQNKTATHGWGSAMSYGRRYLKMLIYDVKLTDDDGKAAGNGGPVNREQLKVLNGLCDAVKADRAALCKYLKIDELGDLAAADYNDAIHVLKQKNQDAARAYLTAGR